MIDVSCAIITDNLHRILVTQRSSLMQLPLKWEFPGGKIEKGETAEECITREIFEELGVSIKIIRAMKSHIYDNGTMRIRLFPFQCMIKEGEIKLAEHASFLWLKSNELSALDWSEADVFVVNNLITKRNGE